MTLRWREMDSNFQYASTVRWHRATDLPLPSTVKRRSAERPPPMVRPRSEAQRGSVNVTLQYLSHDGRPAPRRPSRRHRAARRHRAFANGKIPAACPGRHSVEFRLVREENGNALPGDHARRSRLGARQPLGRTEGGAAGLPSMLGSVTGEVFPGADRVMAAQC